MSVSFGDSTEFIQGSGSGTPDFEEANSEHCVAALGVVGVLATGQKANTSGKQSPEKRGQTGEM